MVALLCEGDLVGYEVSILRQWIDARVGTNPLVDYWPCGTANSIYGMSDAVGRSRPLLVIEDRDYRTVAEAESDSSEKRKDRERRDVRILGWQAWRRSEIENYFLDSEVLLPVMSEAFGCTSEEVKTATVELLPTLVAFQSFQFVFYRVRRAWNKSDPSPLLPNNLQIRPIWSDVSKTVVPPAFDVAVGQLQTNLKQWSGKMSDACDASAENKIPEFIKLLNDTKTNWGTPKWEDDFWRYDWAGKDVLQWLRIILTARFGWPDAASKQRQKLSWEGLNRLEWNTQDRPIEATLKPMLVRQFLQTLAAQESSDLGKEWHGIVEQIQGTAKV
jgi:hypothetical protein